MKCTLGLDKVTPNYILRRETQEEEIRMKAVRRTFKYEEEARSLEKLVRECIKKMERQRREKNLSEWKRRRRGLRRRLGISEDWMEKVREEEEEKIEGNTQRVRKRRGGGKGKQKKKD